MMIIRIYILLFLYFIFQNVEAVEPNYQTKNVLYLSSYNTTYSWGDSITSGVVSGFEKYPDVNLYVEYLDTKRFGTSLFQEYLQLIKTKYANKEFDVIITSDNNALDFVYSLSKNFAPECPVVFCGINNPMDYDFENSRFYGILESPMQDSVVDLIDRIVPTARKLYIITDSTKTSLLNVRHFKSIEINYTDRFNFVYITNPGIDSILNLLPRIDKSDAIAMFTVFQDKNGEVINSDELVRRAIEISNVPIFVDSETMFGKGIVGGIFNSGFDQGRSVSELAIQFLEDPNFVPEVRYKLLNNNLRFDYNALKRFEIDSNLLPPGSILVNEPVNSLQVYLKYIIITILIVLFLVSIIVGLLVNMRKRKVAEALVYSQLGEIQIKNANLEEANALVKDTFKKLETANRTLSNANIELEQAKNKAVESDQLKSAFLANLSHEIRTPLNGIMGFSTLLSSPDLNSDERDEYISIINKSGNYLLSIIDDIIEISKLDTKQVKLVDRVIELDLLLNQVITELQVIIPNDKDIDLRLSDISSVHGLTVIADGTKLKQVIVNLINNAIKYTLHGFVELACEVNEEKELLFSIKDSGIGINKKDFQMIFDRFRQIEKKGLVFQSGSGLGLAISKSYIELMSGRIWLESKEGFGSNFQFAIPLIKAEKPEQAISSSKAKRSAPKEKKLILIAEDEVDNFYLLDIVLSKNGYETIHAKDGFEAIRFVKNRPEIDLVLMDIKMPEMDGIEAAKLLRSTNPELPIIAQTAYALSSDRDRMLKNGFDDYIPKPLDMNKLIELLEAFLEE